MPWQRLCSPEELQGEGILRMELVGRGLLLSKASGSWRAFSSSCVHRGGDLRPGEDDGRIIICPLHFWSFELGEGSCVQVPSMSLKSYPLRIETDAVLIELESVP